jgi:hypothetical protein
VLKSTHPELGHYTYVEENKNGHSYCRNHFTGIGQINAKLLQKLSKKCTVDDVIIKTFVRQRIFIKIHFLNVELQQQKINYGKKKRALTVKQVINLKK